LNEALSRAPERFEMLQAVRLIERAAAALARDPRFAKPTPIGLGGDPRSEALRLRTDLDLSFPASEVVALDESGKRPALTVSMMGLNGVSGVLPSHYTWRLLEALRDKNPVPQDFLDIFNHRAISLFVRASDKYRLPLAYERAQNEGGATVGDENGTQVAKVDAISSALQALVGMRGPALSGRQAIEDETFLFYSGHFAHKPRTAEALRQMLSEYFGQPVAITQFQGSWLNLMRAEQSRLGGNADPTLNYAQLGGGAILGSRSWDVQGAFRVSLGPLDYGQFKGFMPGGQQMKQLTALTRSYVGPGLAFDVQLTLKSADIPPLALGGGQVPGSRLGWNTWLPKVGPRADAKDALFDDRLIE
jgi:type VI secretion system protein ImpH